MDRVHEIGRKAGLNDISESAGGPRRTHEILVVMNSEEYDSGCVSKLLQLLCDLDTCQNGHGNIYDQNIRLQAAGGIQQGLPVPHSSHDIKHRVEKVCDD